MPPELRSPASVAELIELTELVDIVYFKIAGERIQAAADEDADPSEAVAGGAPLETVQVMLRVGEEQLETRAVARVQTSDGRYEIDAAARFTFSQPLLITDSVQREFVERVGIMAVYPYLREGIYSTATKLRLNPPVLGLIRAGTVKLDPEPLVDVPGVEVLE